MQAKQLTISNKLGLHARAAAQFIRVADHFQAKIILQTNARRCDGKNILELLTLGAGYGTTITLTAEGEDETEALQALSELIENRFGEKE